MTDLNYAQPPFLIISGHDFRSRRKTNIHFIARELSKIGSVRFFSIGFSYFSRLKKDPRLSLWDRANQIENFTGVDCYLWKTVIHPVNTQRIGFFSPGASWYDNYVKSAPVEFDQWIRESNTIVIESGMGIAFYEYIKALNTQATVLYTASDSLRTIKTDIYLVNKLKLVSDKLNGIRVPSNALRTDFDFQGNIKLVPQGFDHELYNIKTDSPFLGTKNVVSVGSMLFDRSFFEIACPALPDFNFFIIGAGYGAKGLFYKNLHVIDEMPFENTIRYLQHADIGLAAYKLGKVDSYLADTSMKLIQYSAFGVPAVCPETVAAKYPWRFGYIPTNVESIVSKMNEALQFGKFVGVKFMTWESVTKSIITLDYRQKIESNEAN